MTGNHRLNSVSVTVGIIIILVFCLTYTEGNTSRRFLRDLIDFRTTPKPRICQKSTPCGWSVYKQYTKEIDYYMPNTCLCSEGLDCVRINNNVSISAFVHYCRQKPDD